MEDRPLNSASVEQAVQRDNMLRAWKQVKANKGAPDVDGITVGEFTEYAQANSEVHGPRHTYGPQSTGSLELAL